MDLTEKIRELVALAREQGHLTYDDINDALPESVVTPDDLDHIYTKLNSLDVEIVDQAEVDRVKQPEPEEEEEEKSRLDILDDPVRMYLRQMGKVPLLTREQEVAICQRMEQAENEQRRIVYGFGFAAKEHIALAEKLVSEPPRERFDRVVVDKKVESRRAPFEGAAFAGQKSPRTGPPDGRKLRRVARCRQARRGKNWPGNSAQLDKKLRPRSRNSFTSRRSLRNGARDPEHSR